MQLRTVGYAAAAGLATGLVVLVAVAELLAPSIEFSVLVAIPAGLLAGTVVSLAVVLLVGTGGRTRRALALALGTFGVVHLAVLALGVAGLGIGVAGSVVAATVVGLLGGVVAFVAARQRR